MDKLVTDIVIFLNFQAKLYHEKYKNWFSIDVVPLYYEIWSHSLRNGSQTLRIRRAVFKIRDVHHWLDSELVLVMSENSPIFRELQPSSFFVIERPGEIICWNKNKKKIVLSVIKLQSLLDFPSIFLHSLGINLLSFCKCTSSSRWTSPTSPSHSQHSLICNQRIICMYIQIPRFYRYIYKQA